MSRIKVKTNKNKVGSNRVLNVKVLENFDSDLTLSNKLVYNLVVSIDRHSNKLCKEVKDKLEVNNLRTLNGTGIDITVGKSRNSLGEHSLVITCLYTHGYYKDLVNTSLYKKYNGEKINKTSRASAEMRTNAKMLLECYYDRLFGKDTDGYSYTRVMQNDNGKVQYKIEHRVDLTNTDLINGLIGIVNK